jgi:hypothetical protein
MTKKQEVGAQLLLSCMVIVTGGLALSLTNSIDIDISPTADQPLIASCSISLLNNSKAQLHVHVQVVYYALWMV